VLKSATLGLDLSN